VSTAVSKSGYTFTPNNRNVAVYYYSPSGDATVSFTGLTANGGTSVTTTALTLSFNQDIEGLSAYDISLSSGGTGAVKGSLTRTGYGVYSLAISGLGQSGTLTVTVNKGGYIVTPNSRNAAVYYSPSGDTAVSFDSLTASGEPGTNKLTLTFSQDIADLSADDISLNPGNTGAVKGALSRVSEGTYELAISGVTQNGNVSTAVSKSGYTVIIHRHSRWL
jgi:hypothetical protein